MLQQSALLVLAFGRLASEEKCAPYCAGSCCGFANPTLECAKCDESYTCNPKAPCYPLGIHTPPPPSPPSSSLPVDLSKDASRTAELAQDQGVVSQANCSACCLNITCCGFHEPQADCGGCDESHACHPGALCYGHDTPTVAEDVDALARARFQVGEAAQTCFADQWGAFPREKQRALEMFAAADAALLGGAIPYYACYGTELGARRHGGMIPWDVLIAQDLNPGRAHALRLTH